MAGLIQREARDTGLDGLCRGMMQCVVLLLNGRANPKRGSGYWIRRIVSRDDAVCHTVVEWPG